MAYARLQARRAMSFRWLCKDTGKDPDIEAVKGKVKLELVEAPPLFLWSVRMQYQGPTALPPLGVINSPTTWDFDPVLWRDLPRSIDDRLYEAEVNGTEEHLKILYGPDEIPMYDHLAFVSYLGRMAAERMKLAVEIFGPEYLVANDIDETKGYDPAVLDFAALTPEQHRLLRQLRLELLLEDKEVVIRSESSP